jgi:hypothetical protein
VPEEAAKGRLTYAMKTKRSTVKRNVVRAIERKTFRQEGSFSDEEE